MTKKTLFIWIFLIIFGLSSLPELLSGTESEQAGKTDLTSLVKKRKKTRKTTKTNKKKTVVTKKGSKDKQSAGKKKYTKKKKNYSKKKKYSSKKKYSKKKKYTKKRKSTRRKKYYAPQTNSGSVEYKVYKRSESNINNIAPQKEIRKDPKKEGQ